jgi:Zn finger protein HypA/HybF involved in hydrogenase expression
MGPRRTVEVSTPAGHSMVSRTLMWCEATDRTFTEEMVQRVGYCPRCGKEIR